MKKILIGSFVGTIVLFIWSALSWTVLPLHLHTYSYTSAQDSILKVLADNNVETGAYLMPMADNTNATAFDSKYHEESERVMKENEGKPMATIYYLRQGYLMGAMTFIRGFLFDFLALLAACIILTPSFAAMSSFFGRWWLALLVGLLLSAYGPLQQFNWMAVPWNFTADIVLGTLLDWGVTGLWLAWYFGRK